MATICCSPPERLPAAWRCRSLSRGNASNTISSERATSRASERRYAPRRRFSSTVIFAKIRRPSGMCAMPSAAISRSASPSILRPRKWMAPARRGWSPEIALSRLVFPAPLGPTIAVIEASWTRTVAPFTARALP